MKKISVIVLVVLGLALAGAAEAAKPKKRTRNQNRVGPYVTGLVGLSTYGGDQSNDEQSLVDLIEDADVPFQNEHVGTEDSDLGFQAAFGYRFARYIAMELGLVQYGELTSELTADVDLPEDTEGFVPARFDYAFKVGGPLISAVGILPLGDKFEVYGRVGFLFASVEREFTSRINGQRGLSYSANGDSQDLVYGVGMNFNINQAYAIRAEYQILDDVGEDGRTGTESLDFMSIGMIVRF